MMIGAQVVHVLMLLMMSHLEEQPFASVRSTAQELGPAQTTVYRIFTNDLGLKKFVSHWVPHTLSDEQRHRRVELARSLLMRLESTPQTEVITADESWFYMDYSHDGRWARTGDEVKTRPKRTIGSRKSLSLSSGVSEVLCLFDISKKLATSILNSPSRLSTNLM